MYAETFNVQPWLETSAKWLRWAMQGLGARNSADARWNLQQFWASLEPAKARARSALEWADILTLDAQSQWTLGALREAEVMDLLKRANRGALVSFLFNPKTVWREARSFLFGLKDKNPEVVKLLPQLNALEAESKAAYERSRMLATQAEAAYRKAGQAQHQAGNTAKVAGTSSRRVDDAAALNRRTLEAIATPLPTADFLGLPLWVWAAGAAAVLLLLTASQAPRLVAVGAARKALA